MSSLGMPVERPHWPVSADMWMAADVFGEWVHNQDCRDTARMLMMFAGSVADEKERRVAALRVHDWAAADECVAEIRDLVLLAALCKDHLTAVGYVPGAL